MDPQALEVLLGLRDIIRKSGGKPTPEQMSYMSGAVETLVTIFRQPAEEIPEGGVIKNLFRG